MTNLRKVLIGAALFAAAGAANAATDYPSGYTKCAKEGETCSFSGSRSVAYGKSGTFVYATLTGPITCSSSMGEEIDELFGPDLAESRVIRNGIDAALWPFAERRAALERNTPELFGSVIFDIRIIHRCSPRAGSNPRLP